MTLLEKLRAAQDRLDDLNNRAAQGEPVSLMERLEAVKNAAAAHEEAAPLISCLDNPGLLN